MALSECTKEVIYLRNFLIEFGLDYLANISIFSDNLGAQKLANNPSFYARTKHINIRHHFIRYTLENGLLKLSYRRSVPTEEMAVDFLTKTVTQQNLF